MDLFLHQLGAVPEVGPECPEFVFVPPDSDAEAQPAAAEHGQLSSLFGDDGGLSLWQHQDTGNQFHTGDGGKISEMNEYLAERICGVVGAAPAWPGRWVYT